MWIVNAQDGRVYDAHHEDEPIFIYSDQKESNTTDPDLIMLRTGSNNVAVYRISSRQVILRTKVPARDPRFSVQECQNLKTTLYCRDGTAILAFDMAPGLEDATRLRWRRTSEAGQVFLGFAKSGDTLLARRAPAGISSSSGIDPIWLRIDPETGKTLDEFHPLWSPTGGFRIDGNRMYAFSTDTAYAMDAK